MVRIIYVVLILLLGTVHAEDIYQKECVGCHKKLPTSLQRMFMNYLLVYGGEKNMKAGLKHYLQYPSKHISVMSDLFVSSYGIKQKTRLNSEELDEVLDIYWEKFKVFDKLK